MDVSQLNQQKFARHCIETNKNVQLHVHETILRLQVDHTDVFQLVIWGISFRAGLQSSLFASRSFCVIFSLRQPSNSPKLPTLHLTRGLPTWAKNIPTLPLLSAAAVDFSAGFSVESSFSVCRFEEADSMKRLILQTSRTTTRCDNTILPSDLVK